MTETVDKAYAAYQKFIELNEKRLAGGFGPLTNALLHEASFRAFQKAVGDWLVDTYGISDEHAYALYCYAFCTAKIEDPDSVMDIWYRD